MWCMRGVISYLLRLAFDEVMVSVDVVLNGKSWLDSVVMLQTQKKEAKTLESELWAWLIRPGIVSWNQSSARVWRLFYFIKETNKQGRIFVRVQSVTVQSHLASESHKKDVTVFTLVVDRESKQCRSDAAGRNPRDFNVGGPWLLELRGLSRMFEKHHLWEVRWCGYVHLVLWTDMRRQASSSSVVCAVSTSIPKEWRALMSS